MMQMLACGGMVVVTDGARRADVDNPRGYFELERGKNIASDASWLPAARGKAFKMASQLLYDLPASERYRIVFMDRDLDEVLSSQEKMLHRLGEKAAPRDEMRRSYIVHLDRLNAWLQRQDHMQVLHVSYNGLVECPQREAKRVSDSLDSRPNVAAMAEAVDFSLYRNRMSHPIDQTGLDSEPR